MARVFVILGSINMLLAVALGAFGAHIVRDLISDHYYTIYQTGVDYHMFHSLGILLVGIIALKIPGKQINWSGWLLFMGIVIFSGSLYVLSLTGISILGAITPIGGVSFLIGWLLLALAAYKKLGRE